MGGMKAQIYKLVYRPDPRYFYVGSTTQPLQRRLIMHRSRACKESSRLYQFMGRYPGHDFAIESLEHFEFHEDEERRKKEQGYILLLQPTLNSVRAFGRNPDSKQHKKAPLPRITPASSMPEDLLAHFVNTKCSIVDLPKHGMTLTDALLAFNVWLNEGRRSRWTRSEFSQSLKEHGWYKVPGQHTKTNRGWMVNLKLNKVATGQPHPQPPTL
jgi:hypothetical protein